MATYFKILQKYRYEYGVELETGADTMEIKVNNLRMLEIDITYGWPILLLVISLEDCMYFTTETFLSVVSATIVTVSKKLKKNIRNLPPKEWIVEGNAYRQWTIIQQ